MAEENAMQAEQMSFRARLIGAWEHSDSLVCVGLDPDFDRLPNRFRGQEMPYFEFCREVVDATAAHVAAFKPQHAHFAAFGREAELERLIQYIKTEYPQHVVILDAKRGDIGSTAAYYAEEAYVRYGADAVTVNPYLGEESIQPFLAHQDKGIVVLCRTSNADSGWLQNQGEPPLYLRVAERVREWDVDHQCMLVAGATYPEELGKIRSVAGDVPLLVPGVGAQGGDPEAVLQQGRDADGRGLLISSSRGIIYAFGQGAGTALGESADEFAGWVGNAALELKKILNKIS